MLLGKEFKEYRRKLNNKVLRSGDIRKNVIIINKSFRNFKSDLEILLILIMFK